MTFEVIARTFADGESGTDQFKVFYKAAFDLMKVDPRNAAMYFVVGVAARAYVQKYEDQDLSSEFAERAKDRIVSFNSRLLDALQKGPESQWETLSAIASEYEWDVQEF